MVCCLNPACSQPINLTPRSTCQTCGSPLIPLLRNRFRVQQVLGQGGFGRTYLAQDVDNLDALCVVKQLVPPRQDAWTVDKATQLFAQEAQQLQSLGSHPRIPTLFAYFQEGPFLYLVQQLIQGKNLAQELREEGLFPEAKIWSLLQEILPILEYIHRKAVIHRDIKPDNIIRTQTTGQLVLIDFGVSKSLQMSITGQPGTIVGSLGYAPPEQLQEGLSYAASDLFSLGATCFHLLTYEFPGDLLEAESFNWVNHWQSWLKAPLSPELTLILNKLLQVDYRQRYPSAASVLQASDKFILKQSSIAPSTAVTIPVQRSQLKRRFPQFQIRSFWKSPQFYLLTLLGSYSLAGFIFAFHIWTSAGFLLWTIFILEVLTRTPKKRWSNFEFELTLLLGGGTLVLTSISARYWAKMITAPGNTVAIVTSLLLLVNFLLASGVITQNWDFLTMVTALTIALLILTIVIAIQANAGINTGIVISMAAGMAGLIAGLIFSMIQYGDRVLKPFNRFRTFFVLLILSYTGFFLGWLVYQILIRYSNL